MFIFAYLAPCAYVIVVVVVVVLVVLDVVVDMYFYARTYL